MQIVEQKLEDITAALTTLEAPWQDEHAVKVVELVQTIPIGGATGKCDFVIPDRHKPLILIEAKGYGATGSKMTDVVGDANKIIAAKRPDIPFILITDGITWMRRTNDLRKLIRLQNEGSIMRIYTTKMAAQFVADLNQLKTEYGL